MRTTLLASFVATFVVATAFAGPKEKGTDCLDFESTLAALHAAAKSGRKVQANVTDFGYVDGKGNANARWLRSHGAEALASLAGAPWTFLHEKGLAQEGCNRLVPIDASGARRLGVSLKITRFSKNEIELAPEWEAFLEAVADSLEKPKPKVDGKTAPADLLPKKGEAVPFGEALATLIQGPMLEALLAAHGNDLTTDEARKKSAATIREKKAAWAKAAEGKVEFLLRLAGDEALVGRVRHRCGDAVTGNVTVEASFLVTWGAKARTIEATKDPLTKFRLAVESAKSLPLTDK